MLSKDDLHGIITVMPTAFKDDGCFDEDNYRKNIDKICKSGVNGIMSLGTSA